MWISATQLELMIGDLPNAVEHGPKPLAIFQYYDEAWLNAQTEDLGVAGFYVFFHNTIGEWSLMVDGTLLTVERVLETIRALPPVEDFMSEGMSFHFLRFSKGTYTGPDGRPYTDWSLEMRNKLCLRSPNTN